MSHHQVIEPLEPRQLFAAGDLDPTFGAGGIVRTEGPFSTIHALENDRLLIHRSGTTADLLNADGSLGTKVTFTGGLGDVTTLRPVADGRFLVVAQRQDSNPDTGVTLTSQLERHNNDGTLDTSFGTNGVGQSTNGVNQIIAFAIQPDNRIVVFTGSGLVRLTADGDLDSTFTPPDVNGLSFFVSDILLANDGKIVLFGAAEANDPTEVALMRLNSNGTTDTTFDDDGLLLLGPNDTIAVPIDAAVTPDGSIVLGYGATGQLEVRRFTPAGDLDTSFGTGGSATVALGNRAGRDTLSRVRLLGDGDILVTAEVMGLNQIQSPAMARLNANGTRDTAFPRLTHATTQLDEGIVTSSGKFVFPDDDVPGGDTRDAVTRILLNSTTDGPVDLNAGILAVDGTNGDDLIRLTRAGADVEVSRGDRFDRLFAAADITRMNVTALDGDDIVIIAAGFLPSSVSGGSGADRLIGGEGSDSLTGNAGRDRLDGGPGNDRVSGNGGRDKLSGNLGDDRLLGGSSGDWLAGQDGNDTLTGDGGNDRLTGGAGEDSMRGNAGDDVFFSAGDHAVDELNGDGDDDTATADPNDLLTSIEHRTQGE